MSWFRVDDNLSRHRKAKRAGAVAMGLWVCCGAHASSAAGSGDGFIAFDDVEDQAMRLGIGPDWRDVAARLVNCGDDLEDGTRGPGFWTETRGGFRFHDWSDYRPGSDPLAERRRADAERQAKARGEKRQREAEKKARREQQKASRDMSQNPSRDASRDMSQDDDRTRHVMSRDSLDPARVDPARRISDPVPSRPVHQIPPTPQGAGAPVDEIPEAPSPSAAWLRAIRLAKAPGFVLPKSGLPAGLVAALEQDWADSDGDWPAYCAALADDVGEWVRETVAANRTAFAGGWKWTVFAGWRAERDAKQASGSARSPATAVYVPVDTSDAVPPPAGFLEALKGIGGPALNRGRA